MKCPACAAQGDCGCGQMLPRRKIDRALADLREHLSWLSTHRAAEGTVDWKVDVGREIGVAEAMDVLRRHGAKEMT